ncbi:hypothetical protein ACJX0J_030612 [Zea mays]
MARLLLNDEDVGSQLTMSLDESLEETFAHEEALVCLSLKTLFQECAYLLLRDIQALIIMSTYGNIDKQDTCGGDLIMKEWFIEKHMWFNQNIKSKLSYFLGLDTC